MESNVRAHLVELAEAVQKGNIQLGLIAAANQNNIIGWEGQTPWKLPADLTHFKLATMGRPLIMGAKTFESIGKPLPGRTNMVVSRRALYNFSARPLLDHHAGEGINVATSLGAALRALGDLMGPDTDRRVWCIGGGDIYAQLLPVASRIELTRVITEPGVKGDAWFPDFIGSHGDWVLLEETEVPMPMQVPFKSSSAGPLPRVYGAFFQTWQRK